METTNYTVGYGDTLSGIARAFGFQDYRTIYDFPENAAFKKKRPDPNIIYAGDKLVIPAKDQKSINAQVGSKSTVKVKTSKNVLRLKLVEFGTPLADFPYSLLLQATGEKDMKIEGKKTDQNGMIEQDIPAAYVNPSGPTIAHLIVCGMHYRVMIGVLDPISTISGVQQRLKNMGFYINDEPGEIGKTTCVAVRAFQELNELQVTGKIDDAFRASLLNHHDNDSVLLPAEEDFTFQEDLQND